jgi:Lrp/AsnC family leucine-responsive transcriptional regulator
MIDDTDRKILHELQENARTPNAEIARRVGLVPSGTLERIRKLEERGVIEGYSLRVNASAVELGLLAFLFVRADDRVGDLTTAHLLARVPEVQEVHHIAGEDCYLVKLRARDTVDLARVLREKIGTIKTVRSTRTTIVMNTVKESVDLPIDRDGRTRRARKNKNRKR